MKKAWKVVAIIVAAAILIGLLFIGTGLLTGSDLTRIWDTMDAKYNVNWYVEAYGQWASDVILAILKPFVG